MPTNNPDLPVVRDLSPSEMICRSCPKKFPWPAKYIAHAPRINDLPPLPWPVCEAHAQYAAIAGWLPIDEIAALSHQEVE